MGVWNWLKDPDNRGTLGWFGGGIALVAGALWTVFIYVLPPKDGKSDGKGPVALEAHCGSNALQGNFFGSSITAGGGSSTINCPSKSK
jgi:hypothetical protein